MHDMRLWLDELRAMPRETEWLEFKRAEKSFNFDQMARTCRRWRMRRTWPGARRVGW